MEWLSSAREDIEAWCRGRSPWPRAALLLWMAYVGIRHLGNSDYSSLMGALNLGIHEAGHLLLGWFGWTLLMIAGGTLLQLLAPVGAAVMFARQPDWFAASFCGFWLGTNLYNIATYAADAREMDLPLVSVGGGEALHDWNFMLSALHLLPWDTAIAAVCRLLAFLFVWGSILSGIWMVVRMARSAQGE